MLDKALHQREKQVQNLKAQYEKALRLRDFLLSERKIVIGLLERSLRGQDRERVDNLRTRVQEKERQLHIVKDELREIQAQLREAERRLQRARRGGLEKEP